MAPSGSVECGVETGNTKVSTRESASLYWFFTLNNWTWDEIKPLEIEIKLKCVDYRIQSEVGEHGTPHLQGFIKAFNKLRPSESFSNKRIHWEKVKHPKAAREYCCKEDTRTDDYEFDREEKIILIKPDRPWQLEILNILKQRHADDRVVHWYWEPDGNVGKSQFTKYLCVIHDALCISGKSVDCKYAIVKWKETLGYYPRIIVFDIPRTNQNFISIEVVESIKSGVFFCGKYETGQVAMNSAHLIIFANQPPKREAMTADKWRVVRINRDFTTTEEKEGMSKEEELKILLESLSL